MVFFEALTFFAISFCIPADDSWNCDGKIWILEQTVYQTVLENFGREWTGYHSGLAVSGYKSPWIYLNKEYAENKSYQPKLGCNLLWHEILHAREYKHDDMPLTVRDCPGKINNSMVFSVNI